MRKKILVLLTAALGMQCLSAQQLRVYFTDKGEQDCVALSDKAQERRQRMNIDIDHRDYPVNQAYLNALHQLGARLEMKSRWFNYALIEGLETAQLRQLPFVKKVESPELYQMNLAQNDAVMNGDRLNYGLAELQTQMLRGNSMHNLGYMGDGIGIAVIDAGFVGVRNSAVFDSLWLNNRINGYYNFRSRDTNVFVGGNHGTYVLSILGGNLDSQLVGTAPRASYWLLKSEYEPTETPVEMDHWLAAAEYADSAGADIITSSLGYSLFDNPAESFEYSDMDGNTLLVTKAADMAASKGILVIVSAGNEGSSPWQYITAPADGDSVMAVGAVSGNLQKASFSSIGPTADGRIKPDVMAMGQGTAIATGSVAFTGNGTSFSCPVISGLAACLWQVNPGKSNMEIFNAIIQSSDRHWNPDNQYGFGLPNFEHAMYSIGTPEALQTLTFSIYPNPVEDKLHIDIENEGLVKDLQLILRDASGRELKNEKVALAHGSLEWDFPYASGIFLLELKTAGSSQYYKILK